MAEQGNESLSSYVKEEKEENENCSQTQEEYDEQNSRLGIQEEGQDFEVAFDIQISDGSFILLFGKTQDNKLILRLVDKEDNKQLYQNEFSLEELKQLNYYFNNFTNENDAFNCIIKNFNESEKEIEIMDDNTIKISVVIDEDNGTKIDFILPKIQYILEGEEQELMNNNINIQNEKEGVINENKNEEAIFHLEKVNEVNEEMENENENGGDYISNENFENAGNLEYSEENIEKSDKKEKSNNEHILNSNQLFNQEKYNLNINLSDSSSLNNNINNIEKGNTLQTIIEEANENLISRETNEHIEQKKEIIIIDESNE